MERYGVESLVQALSQCVDEAVADVIITTAHRPKGRQWTTVRVSSNFLHIDDMSDADLKVGYVAVTRASQILDLTEWAKVERRASRTGDRPPKAPGGSAVRRRPPSPATELLTRRPVERQPLISQRTPSMREILTITSRACPTPSTASASGPPIVTRHHTGGMLENGPPCSSS